MDTKVSGLGQFGARTEADAVTTEIIRHALTSAARQMKQATIRTSFSPIIYEMLDFSVVLYDRQIRLLGQAQTLPIFNGSMGFCIEGAVKAVGGEDALLPGDVLIYNIPYGTGAHAQDCAIVMPIFMPNGELVGYAANKAHWIDIGAKAPYCTDTTDVYQEGLAIPGVKLYEGGKLKEDIHRMILANCRFKEAINGDISSQVASCHVGARELIRIIDRFGHDLFKSAVERIFDRGEQVIRDFVRTIPDGTYTARCQLDSDGLDDNLIPFEITVTVQDTDICVDFGSVPAARGPMNCPFPSTVSGARVALAMAGAPLESPNEGHFRPLNVLAEPGSMFRPQEPQPCFLYGWPIMAAMEGIFEVLAKVTGGKLPSGTAGDGMAVLYYGTSPGTGEMFFGGSDLPVGNGASAGRDGATLIVPALAYEQLVSPELQEAKTPILFEKWEFTPDSGGAGEFRGGNGWEVHYRLLQDVYLISTVEHTKTRAWAQAGGLPGNANRFEVDFPDGHSEVIMKTTDRAVPAGSRFRIYCGGGGGYGPPSKRAREAVERDLLGGLVTLAHAMEFYPHAVS